MKSEVLWWNIHVSVFRASNCLSVYVFPGFKLSKRIKHFGKWLWLAKYGSGSLSLSERYSVTAVRGESRQKAERRKLVVDLPTSLKYNLLNGCDAMYILRNISMYNIVTFQAAWWSLMGWCLFGVTWNWKKPHMTLFHQLVHWLYLRPTTATVIIDYGSRCVIFVLVNKSLQWLWNYFQNLIWNNKCVMVKYFCRIVWVYLKPGQDLYHGYSW